MGKEIISVWNDPCGNIVLESDQYMNTQLLRITVHGVTAINNSVSIRIEKKDLEEALKKLKEEEKWKSISV